jgi:hypothetical protein
MDLWVLGWGLGWEGYVDKREEVAGLYSVYHLFTLTFSYTHFVLCSVSNPLFTGKHLPTPLKPYD